TKMNSYIAEPAAQGSALVAFPELCGMETMTLMPRFSNILSDLHRLKSADEEEKREAFFTVCETVQGFVSEIFLNVFSQLARSHRMIIAAGGIYQIENGKLYNRQFLFSEEGDVIGIQDKLFLSPAERMLGVTAGEKLVPGVSRIGKIALLGGEVAQHYEPFWIASRLRCRYAVTSASPFGSPDLELLRFRAQEQELCILAPGLVGGRELRLSFDSPAGIFVPRDLCDDQSGVLAGGCDRLITGKVDFVRCADSFDLYSADKNIRFFSNLVKDN
ncbi:MAG: hypothetical protein IKD01_03570, partial [Oscillospiraceae bacterium]|nr:hypothetical protein [Oscillospiraceae bacterium]